MHLDRRLLAAFAAVIVLCPSPARAQEVDPLVLDGAADQGHIRFDSEARAGLQALWQSSTDARAERVACIGGRRDGGITYITKLEPVISTASVSTVSAEESLRRCAPPQWMGTVHTHIALFDGRPYVTFSGADRGVMRKWSSMWQEDGVFCVLYDARRAYCEAGEESADAVPYAVEPRLDRATPSAWAPCGGSVAMRCVTRARRRS